MSLITSPAHSAYPGQALHELEGWMVLGVISEGACTHIRSIPVLSNSSSSAIALASESIADFQVIGILSETELRKHLSAIEEHRQNVKAGR